MRAKPKFGKPWNNRTANATVSPMYSDLPAETRALLTLHLVPGLGPRLTAALLQRFGSAVAALGASAAELQEVPYVGANLASELAQAVARVDIEKELELLNRHVVRMLALGNPDYPTALAPIP